MKKTVVFLLTILMLFTLFEGALRENVVKGADYSPQDFVGYWINDDISTHNITKIFISISGDYFQVHAFGKCHPTDCDWGISTAKLSDANNGVLNVKWVFSSTTENLTIKLIERNHFEVTDSCHFTDNSGRVDSTITEYFTKVSIDENYDKFLLSLFKNVNKLTFTGAPGIISTTAQAFPLAISSNDSTPPNQIAIAVSKYGNGFVLGLCHDSFFSDSNFDYFDNKVFTSNILNYASKKKILISISHGEFFNQSNANKFSNYVKGLGFEVQFLNGPISTNALSNAGILISGSAWGDISDSEIFAIKDFVNNGGILLLEAVGWSWVSYHSDKTLDDLPANKIGKEFGIEWVNGVIEETKDFICNDATVFTILYPESLFSVKRSSLYSAQSIGSRNGINGGPVYSIAIDQLNTEIVYAGTDYGVFKSLNGGESWLQSSLTIKTYSLAIDPQNTQIIFAGTAEGLFKSNDGGSNWVKIYNSKNCYQVIINPVNSKIILLRANNSSFKSNDGGVNWDTINMKYPATSLAFDALDPNIIFAGTAVGVFKSVDCGNNWVAINNGLPKVTPHDFLYYVSFSVDPLNTQIIYTGTDFSSVDHGIFKSNDGGMNWIKINNGLKTHYGEVTLRIQDIVIDPNNTQTIYIATESAVFGETYNDGGVYKSTNGGNSWTQVSNGLSNTEVKCLAIDPKNTQLIYAGTLGGVFKSTDGGLTWQVRNNGLSATDSKFLAMNPNNNEIIYAGTEYNGVFKSTDGGLTWQEKNKGLADWHIKGLAIDTQNTEVVYAGTREGLFKSINGGENWFKIFSKPTWLETFTLDPKNPQTIYVSVAGTSFNDFILFKSTDGGLSWKAIPPQVLFINDIIVDYSNPHIIYIATFDGIYRSTDAGLNWSLINNGLTDTSITIIAFDPINSQIIYAVTLHDRIFKSTDSGMHWAEITNIGQTGISGIRLKITDIVYEAISNNLFRVPYAAVNIRDLQIFFVGTTKYFLSRVFNITSISEYGGSISPSGTTTVNSGDSKTFTITPNTGFKIKDIKVDGVSVGAVSTYTFSNVTQDHIIEAQFEPITFTITASSGVGGTMTPSGTVSINYGESKTFTITPDKGYKIKDVKVDGKSVGAVSKYTFTNVTDNHTIEATFEKNEIVIVLQVGQTSFTVNGSPNTLDSPPIIKNGRTLLPIRPVVEALGGTVGWDGTERKVTVSLGSTTIELWIGKNTARVNGTNTPIDSTNSKVVPEIINGRTMLPLRFVTENLVCQLQWNPNTKTITIKYGG